jgi:hypothetical protein
VKISIRVFLLFTIFQFINSFALSINNLIATLSFQRINISEISTLVFLPFILIWIIYIIVVIILWKKSEIIAEKIVGAENSLNIELKLNSENILSVGIIILGIYLIIEPLPRLFSFIATYVVSRTRFVENDFWREFSIRQMIDIIGLIFKLLSGLIIIRFNEQIVKKIDQINESKPNIA